MHSCQLYEPPKILRTRTVRISANDLERVGVSSWTNKNEHECQNHSVRTAFMLYNGTEVFLYFTILSRQVELKCASLNRGDVFILDDGPTIFVWIGPQSSRTERIKVGIDTYMMTSSNGNIFCVTGPLWGESTGYRWIILTKVSDAELWCFLWSAPEQTIEQTIEISVIWDTIALIMTSL